MTASSNEITEITNLGSSEEFDDDGLNAVFNIEEALQNSRSVDNLKHLITFDFIIFAIKPIDLNNLLNKLNKFTFKKTVVFITHRKVDQTIFNKVFELKDNSIKELN